MGSEPDYYLEIDGLEDPAAETFVYPQVRPWLGVHFQCCGVYTRIYRNSAQTAYEGRCPRCMRAVRAVVGPGGTAVRFFRAE